MTAIETRTGIGDQGSGIKHFTDLDVWQIARECTVFIYAATKKYPDDERFGLISQMRRAAVSITSNIAEGFDRYHTNDKKHFYLMARSSCTELESQLIISSDLGYLSKHHQDEGRMLCKRIQQGVTGLIHSMRLRSLPPPRSPIPIPRSSFPDPPTS